MNASKENCRKAQELLDDWGENTATQSKQFLADFLAAAEKKLLSEEAYKTEKNRTLAKQYGNASPEVTEAAERGYRGDTEDK
jgi:t-SNARE complex subunit (syntaxin)